jgi:hypothetical protein
MRRRVACALLGALVACGHAADPVAATETDAGVEAEAAVRPKPKTPGVIAWNDAVLYNADCDNLVLVKNYLRALAGKDSGIKIMFTIRSGCDPRVDPRGCNIADQTKTAPFFDMVKDLGTIDFKPITDDLSSYDVIMASYCHGYLAGKETILDEYVKTRGGLLVGASNSCIHDNVYTASEASGFLLRYGIQYTTADPLNRDCFPIPPLDQKELLAGVSSVYLFRAAPLDVTAPSRVIFNGRTNAPAAAIYERSLP